MAAKESFFKKETAELGNFAIVCWSTHFLPYSNLKSPYPPSSQQCQSGKKLSKQNLCDSRKVGAMVRRHKQSDTIIVHCSPKLLPLSLLLIFGGLIFASGGCQHTRELPAGLLALEMIAIPGGTFTMGDIFTYENIDATPVHPVTLPDYKLAKTETTFAQYDAFALKSGRPLPDADTLGRGNRAVVSVNWDEAKAFCTSYGFRLPTEQEWEYAAREGGKEILFSGAADESIAAEYVNYQQANGPRPSTIVALLKPNALGLYDMSGNVFEWLGMYYEFYPNPDDAPIYQDTTVSSMRAVRGGSAGTPLMVTTTIGRATTLRSTRSSTIGFRCARDIRK